MTAMSTHPIRGRHRRAVAELEAACEQLYRAELALHDARQTHVDAWIFAASEQLHTAVLSHARAEAALASVAAGAA